MATCASESRFHNQLVDYGALVEAQRLLHSCKDLSTVAEAARLLGNIAQTGSGRHRVVDSGGVEELIERLIRSADKAPAAPIPDIVNALHNVCLSEKASLTAWLRGAISILVQLAARTGEVDLEMLKEVCVNTLVNIAQTGQKNNVLRTIEQAIEQIQVRCKRTSPHIHPPPPPARFGFFLALFVYPLLDRALIAIRFLYLSSCRSRLDRRWLPRGWGVSVLNLSLRPRSRLVSNRMAPASQIFRR